MKKIGSRAEVYHGNAEKTKGGLTKDDLKQNDYGNIVSIKQSNRMLGSANPLRKKGYLQEPNSGKFGPNNNDENKTTNKKEWSFF
jgi:hypothetical protein